MLKEGLVSPPGVTLVGRTAYALEGKILYLIDPKLKGRTRAVPGRGPSRCRWTAAIWVSSSVKRGLQAVKDGGAR